MKIINKELLEDIQKRYTSDVPEGHISSKTFWNTIKWANEMEEKIKEGSEIKDIAFSVIPKEFYSMGTLSTAVRVLQKTWQHGLPPTR